jgi:hypothetical protein
MVVPFVGDINDGDEASASIGHCCKPVKENQSIKNKFAKFSTVKN